MTSVDGEGVNEAMHGAKEQKLRLGERRSRRTVRKEFNRESEPAGERRKKEKERNHNITPVLTLRLQ